jgi:hypothetical protein
MQHKINELNRTIKAKAAELGLIFVDGPDVIPAEFRGASPGNGKTNGQDRAVYLFGVAEA